VVNTINEVTKTKVSRAAKVLSNADIFLVWRRRDALLPWRGFHLEVNVRFVAFSLKTRRWSGGKLEDKWNRAY
jgi:hypothetical protein